MDKIAITISILSLKIFETMFLLMIKTYYYTYLFENILILYLISTWIIYIAYKFEENYEYN